MVKALKNVLRPNSFIENLIQLREYISQREKTVRSLSFLFMILQNSDLKMRHNYMAV
jgi:hypothetical protein